MVARQAVLIEALLVALLAPAPRAEESNELQYDLTKKTWQKIEQMGDIGIDSESLLQQYTGTIADYCRDQLPQQDYRASLDKKLASYKSKLVYSEKLLKGDLLKCGSSDPCKKEYQEKHKRNMDAYISNANVYIPGLKAAAIKNLKDFMDSCTSGNISNKEQDQQVTKRSLNQDQGEYSEPGNQYHW